MIEALVEDVKFGKEVRLPKKGDYLLDQSAPARRITLPLTDQNPLHLTVRIEPIVVAGMELPGARILKLESTTAELADSGFIDYAHPSIGSRDKINHFRFYPEMFDLLKSLRATVNLPKSNDRPRNLTAKASPAILVRDGLLVMLFEEHEEQVPLFNHRGPLRSLGEGEMSRDQMTDLVLRNLPFLYNAEGNFASNEMASRRGHLVVHGSHLDRMHLKFFLEPDDPVLVALELAS